MKTGQSLLAVFNNTAGCWSHVCTSRAAPKRVRKRKRIAITTTSGSPAGANDLYSTVMVIDKEVERTLTDHRGGCRGVVVLLTPFSNAEVGTSGELLGITPIVVGVWSFSFFSVGMRGGVVTSRHVGWTLEDN